MKGPPSQADLVGFLKAVIIRANRAHEYLNITDHDNEQRVERLIRDLFRLRDDAWALFCEVTR